MSLEQHVISFDVLGGDATHHDGQPITHLTRAIPALARASLTHPHHLFLAAGPKEQIKRMLDNHDHSTNIDIEDMDEAVSMGERHTSRLFDGKKTIGRLSDMLHAGDVDVVVSNGNSAATVANARKKSRLKHVRPSLPAYIPIAPGHYVTDVGATKDSRARDLYTSATLTRLYIEKLYGIDINTIGLLDGPTNDKATHLFRNTPGFIGTITPHQAYSGTVDLVVADGFRGNIYLKTIEATARAVMRRLHDVLGNSKLKRAAKMLLSRDELFKRHFAAQTDTYFPAINNGQYHFLSTASTASTLSDANAYPPGSRIGVLSNGEEETKGNKHAKELRETLRAAGHRPLYVEPMDLLNGCGMRSGIPVPVHTVATDDWTRRLYQSTLAATEHKILELIEQECSISRILTLRANPRALRDKHNPDKYNGTGMLGVNGKYVIGHGSASELGIENALAFGALYANSDYLEHQAEAIEEIRETLNRAA